MPEDLFGKAYQKIHDFIFFECLDDNGKPQGYAIGEIQKKYRADSDGAFVELRYVQCTDDYYRHWVSEQSGERLFHHLCSHSLSTCKRKIGNEGGVVHVQRWAPMSKSEVVQALDYWGLTGLKPTVGSGPRMYTRKFTRMYTRTACRSYSYVHADKFTTTRARILSAENGVNLLDIMDVMTLCALTRGGGIFYTSWMLCLYACSMYRRSMGAIMAPAHHPETPPTPPPPHPHPTPTGGGIF